MLKRIAKLLRISPPEPTVTGLLLSHGDTVPTDATAGYEHGCVFSHTDGTTTDALYINEGTVSSCDFNAVETPGTAYFDGVTPGTAAASKAVVLNSASHIDAVKTTALSIGASGSATLVEATAAELNKLHDVTAGAVTASKALVVDSGKGLDRLFVDTAPESITVPALSVGTYSVPVVDATLANNVAFEAVMSTATSKTSAGDTSAAAFVKMANTAATTNTQILGLCSSVAVGFNCFDAYAVQGHITVGAGGISTQNANAHIAGLSGKANLSGAVGQGWVTGVLAIMEGPGAVTGLCHVIAAQVEATCTDSVVDAILYLGADALAVNAIEVADVAHVTNLLKLNAASGCILANQLVPASTPDAAGVGADKALRIVLDGTAYYIPLYDTLHA
jgi:hypothetical protein